MSQEGHVSSVLGCLNSSHVTCICSVALPPRPMGYRSTLPVGPEILLQPFLKNAILYIWYRFCYDLCNAFKWMYDPLTPDGKHSSTCHTGHLCSGKTQVKYIATGSKQSGTVWDPDHATFPLIESSPSWPPLSLPSSTLRILLLRSSSSNPSPTCSLSPI